VFHEAATYDNHFVKPRSGGLLLLRRVTPLPRRDAVYFCSGAYNNAPFSQVFDTQRFSLQKCSK